MGLFGRGNSGGLMNVIRCDEKDYMVWKWRPAGQDVNSTTRENSIRMGSTLHVKDGELAVFFYKQKNGVEQEFIMGPYNGTINTDNFPILTSLLGLAYGGDSPFQAEVYFINLQYNNQLRFAIPYFDVFDPRLPEYGVPVAVRGILTFRISDYKAFIKLNRLINFNQEDFRAQIKDALIKYVKGAVMKVPSENAIPVMQMETRILEINDTVEQYLKPRLEESFGVNVRGFDISAVELDKENPNFTAVMQITGANTARMIQAQVDLNLQNLEDMQRINKINTEETLRMQREEAQYAQHMQVQSGNLAAHTINQQATVLGNAASSLGNMGTVNLGGGDGGGLNPAGMMTGMMLGGAMGGQMAGMMNQMGQQVQMPGATPPPLPNTQYMLAVGGAQFGPYDKNQLATMASSGQFTPQTHVWTQGMTAWDLAANIPELAALFAPQTMTPPPPPVP